MWLALIALAGVGAPAAHGASEYQYPFTPELAFGSSSSRAGDHPALRLEMHKPFNHCVAPEPPYKIDNPCWELYMQQNLKKLAVHLPPGFAFDARAAPYCDPFTAPGGWQQPDEVWLCRNEDAQVGRVQVTAQACDLLLTIFAAASGCLESPFDFTLPDGVFARASGIVYNETPRPGEEGHLVVLWPKHGGSSSSGAAMRADFSVTKSASDGGTDLIADDISDVWPQPDGWSLPAQVTDLVLMLEGDVGRAAGHPLIANPTSCDPGTLGVDFQGYAENSHLEFSIPVQTVPGEGEGRLASFSVPNRASECDSLPFDPALSVNVDASRWQEAPAVSLGLEQRRGEATAEQLKLTFPRSFEINWGTTVKQCSQAKVATRSCPSASSVGDVETELLEGQTLSGHAYLTGITDGEVKLTVLLGGAFELRFDATLSSSEDGSPVLAFDNVPPVARLEVRLAGGAQGLLRASNACGPQTVVTEAESRLGHAKRDLGVVEMGACPIGTAAQTQSGDAPVAFVARLSERRPGRLTDLHLAVASQGPTISAVQYRLDGRLDWRGRQRQMLDRRGAATAGWILVDGASGARKARLKVLRGGHANLFFRPSGPAGSRRDGAGHGLAPLWLQLSRATAAPAGGEVGRPRRRPGPRQSTLTLSGLPLKGVTASRLSLRGRGRRSPLLLRNPARCGRPLGFEAVVWVAGGQKRTLSQAVPLMGPGCALR